MENIVEKSNFSSFHNIFNISLTSKVQLPISLLNVVNQIIFSSILQTWYVELRISRSISESPLEFEITRVDCMLKRNIQALFSRTIEVLIWVRGYAGLSISSGDMWYCGKCKAPAHTFANVLQPITFSVLSSNAQYLIFAWQQSLLILKQGTEW